MGRIKSPVLTFCVQLPISATLFVARSMIKDRPRTCIQFPYTSLPSLRTPCEPPDASAQLQAFYEEFSTSARSGSTPLVIPFKFLRRETHYPKESKREHNPSKLVRQNAKRERTPDILELAELQLLLSKLTVRERTLALLDAATGLRGSELLALRGCDVDFENLELRVTRSIWHQVLGNCKTEASAKPVPMDSYMAEDLLRWRRQSVYASDDDYVFASETMRGMQPYWPDNLMKRHIQPIAKAIGIP